MRVPLRRFVVPFLAASAALTLPTAARAQTYTWTGTTSGVFSNPANWLGGVVPPATGSANTVLQFTVPNGFSYASNDLNGNLLLNQFVFDNRGSTALSLNRLNGNTSAFTLGGTNPAIVQNGNGEVTFFGTTSTTGTTPGTILPVTLASDVTVGGPGLGDVTIGAQLLGPGRLVIAGGAPTANTRVVSVSNYNANLPNGFGGVVIDGGNFEIAGSSGNILGGTASAATTLSVTANGGVLNRTISTSTTTGLYSNIDVAAGGTLRLLGSSSTLLATNAVLSGGGNLVLGGSGSFTVQSASTLSGTVGTDLSPLAGSGTSSPGDIILSGANGSLLNASAFNIRAGGGLTLGTSAAANSNRIGDAAAVNLSSGAFTLIGAAGTSVNEVAGALTGDGGYSTVTVGVGGTLTAGTGTARDTSVQFASLDREGRGTFAFAGTNLGLAPAGATGQGAVGRVLFAAAPTADLVGGGGAAGTTTISILPYAAGGTSATSTTGAATVNSLVTYGPNGVRALDLTTEYATSLTAGPTANVRTTGTTAAPVVNNDTVTVNALVNAGTGGITGTGTIRVGSGTVLNASVATITNNLAFQGAEANVFANTALTLSGNLTGSNGLTKSGTSTLTLTGNNTGLAGPLTINAGRLIFGAADNLPGTGTITANGTLASTTSATGLTYTGTAPLDVTRDIALTGGYLNIATSNGTGSLTLSGTVSGPGGLAISGGSTTAPVVLTGANTYTGPTRVSSGFLVIDGDQALGNGGGLYIATAASGGLRLAGDWTTSRHIELTTSRVDTAGFSATWNGAVTGISTLTKSGAGTLTINSSNPFRGTVLLENAGGAVRLAQNGQLNSTTYTLNNDGSLILDNSALPSSVAPGSAPVTVDRVSDAATVSVATGGTLTVLGNSGRTVTERIGRLTGPTTAGIQGTLEVVSPTGQLTIVRIGNLSVGSAGSLLVRGTGLGQTTGTASQVFIDQFNTANVSNGQLLANVFAEDILNPGVIEGALYDTAVGVRKSGVSDFVSGPLIQNAAPTNTPTGANFRVTSSTQTVDAANTISSLRFTPGSALNASSGTLTVATGNFITEAGTGVSTIAGGTLTSGIASGTTNNVLAYGLNSDLTVNSVLAGNGGVSKIGTATLTLGGANTVTGTVTVGAGTLRFAPGGSLVGGAAPNNLSITAGATVDLNNTSQTVGTLAGTAVTGTPAPSLTLGTGTLTVGTATASTFAGVISGAGSVNKVGTGTLTLSGANTYSGGTTANAGLVAVADVAQLGTGAVTLAGGGVSYTGATASAPLAGLNITAAGGTLSASSTTTGAGLTLPASFTWDGPLTKAGSGRVLLSGPAATTQALTVSLGTVVLNNNNLTVGSLSGAGVVDVGAGTLTTSSTSFATDVTGAGGTLALPAGSTFNPIDTAQTISANITGATAINYIPTASGVLTLGGTNALPGGVAGNAFARYALTNPQGFGAGGVTINKEAASTAVDIAFNLGAGAPVVATPIALSEFGGLSTNFSAAASSTVSLSGLITRGGPSTADNFTQTLLRLTGTSSATTGSAIKFTNPNNTFQAIIEVGSGSLAVDNNAALGLAENVIRLGTGSTTTRAGLRFDAAFTGANAFPRTVQFRSANNINTQGFDVVLAGPVTDAVIAPTQVGNQPAPATGTFTKIGTGTLTLANANNTHTGLVNVNEGVLSVTGNVAAGGSTTNLVNVNTGARLQGTGVVSRPVNLNAGGTLQGGVGAAAGTLSVESVTVNDANTLRAVVGGTPSAPAAGLVSSSGALTVSTAGTAADLTTILLVNDGSLIADGTATYTVTVATFNTTNATQSNFVVAAENFTLGSASVLLDPGANGSLMVTFTPVPEPGAVLAAAGAGLAAAGWVRRRQAAVV